MLIVNKRKSFDKYLEGDFDLKNNLIKRDNKSGMNYIYTGLQVIKPEVMTKVDVAGAIYDRPNMIKSTNNGNTTLDVTSLLSSDGKFETGMYRSEATHIDVIEPWGHDEFFYVIEVF